MFTIPAGKYVITDPCYVLQDDGNDGWSKILTETHYFEKPLVRDGATGIAFSTAYGDGSYSDNYGRSYGVDSGMIGAIALALCTRPLDNDAVVVEFDKPTLCHTDGDTLTFGNIEIKTGLLDEEEDDFEFVDDEEELLDEIL